MKIVFVKKKVSIYSVSSLRPHLSHSIYASLNCFANLLIVIAIFSVFYCVPADEILDQEGVQSQSQNTSDSNHQDRSSNKRRRGDQNALTIADMKAFFM
jgi:hypothetical protein